MSKIKQEDIFFKEENTNTELLNNIEKELPTKSNIPPEYIPVKFDSVEKLSAPQVLHFRMYNMREIIKLSTSRKTELYENIVSCLNAMCFEKFDCGQLTEQEIKSILFTIYGTWIDSHVRGFTYYIDLDLDDDKMDSESNIGEIDLEVKNLQTITLPKEFQEPINVTIDNLTIGFRLPRMNDFILVNEYLKKYYFATERQFSDIEELINNKDSKLEYEQVKKYNDYKIERSNKFLELATMQTLYSYNGVILDTIEKRIEYFERVTIFYWETVEEYVKNLEFGLKSEVKFICPVSKKELVRRFNFRLEDFIPKNFSKKPQGIKISFG